MKDEAKPREWWVKAQGNQQDCSIKIAAQFGDIDLTNPGEDRWIYTIIQTVNPGNNPVSLLTKWLNFVERSAYDAMAAENKRLREALESIVSRGKGTGGAVVCTTETLRAIAREALGREEPAD